MPAWFLGPVGPQQAGDLADVHAASFVEAWQTSAFERLLTAEATHAWAAYADHKQRVIGFVLVFAAADEAEVLTIAVLPEHRRAGVAQALLRALRRNLAGAGICHLHLEVAADNAAAYGLYRRQGFVETGRRKGYYARAEGPRVDALTLSLTLRTPED